MATILSVSSLVGDKVVNLDGEDLGKLEEVMLDLELGTVAYAVVSFGGVLGFGDKLFAVPWEALSVDQGNDRLLLNVSRARLKAARGFDKYEWPAEADGAFLAPDADEQPSSSPEPIGTGVAGRAAQR